MCTRSESGHVNAAQQVCDGTARWPLRGSLIGQSIISHESWGDMAMFNTFGAFNWSDILQIKMSRYLIWYILYLHRPASWNQQQLWESNLDVTCHQFKDFSIKHQDPPPVILLSFCSAEIATFISSNLWLKELSFLFSLILRPEHNNLLYYVNVLVSECNCLKNRQFKSNC